MLMAPGSCFGLLRMLEARRLSVAAPKYVRQGNVKAVNAIVGRDENLVRWVRC